VGVRTSYRLVDLRRVGSDQQQLIAAVAVADSHQTRRVAVDGYHAIAGCQQ
jgi:hypothetical protein